MKWCNLLLLLLMSCSSKETNYSKRLKESNLQIDKIGSKGRVELPTTTFKEMAPPHFPWEGSATRRLPPITKEYFRCKGNPLNPKKKWLNERGQTEEISDCGGYEEHGLPVANGKEEIPQALVDLLNNLQKKLDRRVVITSGHRCSKHNRYVDPSKENKTAKHLLGTEVSFYVEDYERRPQEVLKALFSLFPKETFKQGAESLDVAAKPWYSQDLMIKLYNQDEGRNFDNRHPYPYLSVQTRKDHLK